MPSETRSAEPGLSAYRYILVREIGRAKYAGLEWAVLCAGFAVVLLGAIWAWGLEISFTGWTSVLIVVAALPRLWRIEAHREAHVRRLLERLDQRVETGQWPNS